MDKRTFLKTAGLLTLSGLVSSNAGLANTLLSNAPTLPQSTPETTAAGSFCSFYERSFVTPAYLCAT